MVPAQGAAAPSCWGFGPTTWPRGGPPLSQAQVGLELAGPPPGPQPTRGQDQVLLELGGGHTP